MKIIDAKNMILGRMATRVAKMAILGEEIVVVNCEKAYISGRPSLVKDKFQQRRDRGVPLRGPYISRSPDCLVRRTVRGMLPYKQEKGLLAYKRVMTYIGVPEKYSKEKLLSFNDCEISKLPTLKFVSLKDISRHIGSKRLGD